MRRTFCMHNLTIFPVFDSFNRMMVKMILNYRFLLTRKDKGIAKYREGGLEVDPAVVPDSLLFLRVSVSFLRAAGKAL